MQDPHPLSAGLYLVSTPIGASRDITLRALDILAAADVIAAEDTRTVRHLMQIHGIPAGERPFVAYHDHSGPKVRARLVEDIAQGRSVAYVSEAGTPLVADPGYHLCRAVIEAELPVTAAPGASALLTALAVAGLPTDRVYFAGFPPAQEGARRAFLRDLARTRATLVFYESPRRVARLLDELAQVMGAGRPAAVCRELTKKFEEISRAPLGALAENYAGRTVKGEIVVLVDRPGEEEEVSAETLEAALRAALQTRSRKDAVAEVATVLNLPRRQVYQAALELKE
ncbi:16S rRNA (cytidine1402-2'-O)-methyltransferase [Rhodovulum imhoffii]|uniref:Ribosomal RNA small subunit methyltransferase I n=1 Tax=Rhodovulum imhoffii TaxID=365340 RepID=A0A2T5BNZ9_9RHOB|nr:16S rRNA (cytidine(1402)-2'-O)-methyltransferase [Rhodovulum imhoffii]MBK5933639.1 16S rRNA (cytidine(1402)-2'-O)-methyltransferase [Rhodovulum imhoffii]PTN00723.1 16S rRNA (cytidine1402-2'-O)-methyltransferase [Rhodovulum imhoffii]